MAKGKRGNVGCPGPGPPRRVGAANCGPLRFLDAKAFRLLPTHSHECAYGADQLHPWLVPHWVQTPQAPARMTLSEPQFEQVTPM